VNNSSDIAVIVVGVVAIAALILSVWDSRRQGRTLQGQLAAFEAAEAEVRRLLDELPEAVLLVDTEGVVHSTNAAALTMFAMASGDLVDGHLLDHAEGDEQEVLGDAIDRAFDGEEIEPIQIEVIAGVDRRVVVEGSFHLPAGSVDAADDDRRLVVRIRYRRPPGWRWFVSTTVASSTPTSPSARCCAAR